MDDTAQKPTATPTSLPQIDSSTPPPPPPPTATPSMPTPPTAPSAPFSAPEPLPSVHPMPMIDEVSDPVPTPVIASKKTWGTGALVGSVMALVLLVAGLGFGLWQVRQNQQVVQPKASGSEVTNMCNGTGCGHCNSSGCSGGGAIATFNCSGRQTECRSGESWGGGGANPSCGQTVQVDVFDKKCRKDDGSWDDSCQLLDFVVVYGGDCGTSTPPPSETPQCTLAPKVMISVNDGPFTWHGATLQVQAGDKICHKTDPAGYKYSSRPTPDGSNAKGAVNSNGGTACFTVVAGDIWTTGRIEAYENQCNGSTDGTCEQLNYRESCVNRTDLVLSTATPTPTPTPTYQCEMVKVQSITRAGVAVTDPTVAKIQLGDVVVFRATANGVGATVSKIKFTLTKGGVAQTPSEVATTVVAGKYQADYSVTVSTATSYAVKGEPISP